MKTSAGLKCALCKYPQTPSRGRDRVWGHNLAPGLESHPSTTVSSWTREELVSDMFNFPEDNGMLIETPDEIPGALKNCRIYNRQCDQCPGLSGLEIRLSINALFPVTFTGRECCLAVFEHICQCVGSACLLWDTSMYQLITEGEMRK